MVKRVSPNSQTARAQEMREIERPEIPDRVEAPQNSGFLVREQLSTLMSARRAPPKLKLRTTQAKNDVDAPSEALSPEALSALSDIKGDRLAIQLAELSLHLSQLDMSDYSLAQRRGVNAVNQLMRMCEHLHILKTSQPLQ